MKTKRVTKSRINAIHNAGTMIQNIDFASGLSDREVEDHHFIGGLLIMYSDDVLRLLLKNYENRI